MEIDLLSNNLKGYVTNSLSLWERVRVRAYPVLTETRAPRGYLISDSEVDMSHTLSKRLSNKPIPFTRNRLRAASVHS